MNNITRNNYEEYFILFLDNELTEAQGKELQFFLQENPDLQAELDLLSGTKLSVDETVVFPDKELLFAGSLLQETTEQNVSAQDSEIIMYLDAELNNADKTAFEQKLADSPVLQKELALFAKTKLQAQTAVVYPDKESLYKEENKRRIVPMYWLRMGVAAAVLLTLGVGGFKWLNNPAQQVEGGSMAVINTPEDKGPQTEVIAAATEAGEQAEQVITSSTETVLPTTEQNNVAVTNSAASVHYATNKNTGNNATAVTNQPATALVQTTTTNSNDGNNLPSGEKNPNINGLNNASTGNGALADTKPISTNSQVTVPPLKSNQASFASNNQYAFDEVVEVEEPENKKNKLRGFLRKVTRNFQKQTSIDMTNGDDQLLVAGFAFKM